MGAPAVWLGKKSTAVGMLSVIGAANAVTGGVGGGSGLGEREVCRWRMRAGGRVSQT